MLLQNQGTDHRRQEPPSTLVCNLTRGALVWFHSEKALGAVRRMGWRVAGQPRSERLVLFLCSFSFLP